MKSPIRPSADKTRKAILRTAEKLFAKKGFSGTSINDIADTIRINKSLIYHHFVNKEGLWKEVRLSIAKEYEASSGLEFFPLKKDLKSFLKQVIYSRYDFLQKNPNVLRIMHWQRLEPQPQKFQTSKFNQLWRDSICELQNKGAIRSDLDPDMVTLFILGAFRSVFEEASGFFRKEKPTQQKKYLDFIITNLYRALKPQPHS